MASATLSVASVANASVQASAKGFSEFSGLRSSASFPVMRKSSDDFVSVISFQTSAVGGSGYKKGVAEAKLKVAINGFGRIGRNFLRCWHGRKDSPLDVIVINDTGGVKQASHLLKYDSTLGTFEADVKAVGDDAISVDGKVIKVVSSRNPLTLPWNYLGAGHGLGGPSPPSAPAFTVRVLRAASTPTRLHLEIEYLLVEL